MRKFLKPVQQGTRAWLPAVILVVGISACVNNPGVTRDLKKHSRPEHVRSVDETRDPNRSQTSLVPVRTIHNTGYVSLSDVARTANYHGVWLRDGSYGIGEHDPIWKFRTGESAGTKAGKKLQMSAPAIKESNQLYIPVSALRSLFAPELTMQSRGGSISFMQRAVAGKSRATGGVMPFADAQVSPGRGGMLKIASAGDADTVIEDGRKYLGVRYEFGTGNYDETGTFDCSSFVRYLFDKVGVSLPRTAREQAQEGKSVSRDQLQKGDLMFFTVPGRFNSDETPGHVGIYMGGGKMLHSCPAPKDGVQITDINSAYWQRMFLYAKRVL
ncbi:C40 family peptidase [Paenibacillus sp. sptzw28]|uniref:C40 family peptidase n=1 Tax=Paenibacillus sp. sptzw28 TaxID=715179 RepID=UPI001C6F3CDD|nr:C40 family peptidase [Paenibacillus sp. sptzw28]QYR19270.1 C40 family peptidase [Paenibacillus sp. sptzw28]